MSLIGREGRGGGEGGCIQVFLVLGNVRGWFVDCGDGVLTGRIMEKTTWWLQRDGRGGGERTRQKARQAAANEGTITNLGQVSE